MCMYLCVCARARLCACACGVLRGEGGGGADLDAGQGRAAGGGGRLVELGEEGLELGDGDEGVRPDDLLHDLHTHTHAHAHAHTHTTSAAESQGSAHPGHLPARPSRRARVVCVCVGGISCFKRQGGMAGVGVRLNGGGEWGCSHAAGEGACGQGLGCAGRGAGGGVARVGRRYT